MPFCQFLKTLHQIQFFNVYLLCFSHLYVHLIKFYSIELHSIKLNSMELHSPNFCVFVSIKFNAKNIIFNQRPIVINKVNINSGKNYKNYYH